MNELAQVWMCGGGTQSCAIAALIFEGFLPKPDVSIIADTGREAQSTWHYLDLILNPAMAKIGIQIERVKAQEYGYGGDELFSKTDELLIPAFTNINGSTGKLPAFCNRWWKLDAIRVFLSKKKGLTRSKYRSWIGFSLDESKRYLRMMEGDEYKAGKIWFPLVDLRLRRHQSIEIVKSMGWPAPPRSRCWMCPNQTDREWNDLKQSSPSEFESAVLLEKEMQQRDPYAWLHKSCKLISAIDFTEQEDLFNRSCDSGTCFL